MAIEAGTQLGLYEIADPLGAGGMGEVYRAKDTKLDRDVAIKVLPDLFASDPERLARFEREAKVLASLNHPNIAAIYGLEDIDGRRFLVMELVEGETLADRLKTGPLPVDETLHVGRQIAEALEAAHDSGIIHRDLKPANVMITPDGRGKVLDFGLAKAFAAATDRSQTSIVNSPTITRDFTQPGVVLGTAAYMSPEQARGKTVDKRTDIWSFGCVVYECLGGQRPFHGETATDLIAKILERDPEWSVLPANTPPNVHLLLRRCLTKNPDRRLRDIGDARIEIENAIADPTTSLLQLAGSALAVADRHPRRRFGGITVALLVVLGAILGGSGIWLTRPDPPLRKFEIPVDDLAPQWGAAISPDGRKVAYIADDQLWVRELGQLTPRALPETENARHPFWSPDSSYVGYMSERKLWKASVRGGTTMICELPGVVVPIAGAGWGTDNRIVLATGGQPLHVVSAQGGDPRVFVELDKEKEEDHHDAKMLPRGKGTLFVVHLNETGANTIALVSEKGRKVLLHQENERFFTPVYSPSGHILYHRSKTTPGIWAMPFSLSNLEVTGEPFLVVADAFKPSVSRDGTLVYIRGAASTERQLVWVDRAGEVLETIGQPQQGMWGPNISPDGRFVSVSAEESDDRDIWLHDVTRGTTTRFTFGKDDENSATWHPNRAELALTTGTGVNRKSFMKPTDGVDAARAAGDGWIRDFSPNGIIAVMVRRGEATDDDIWALPLDDPESGTAIVQSPADEDSPAVSPDGNYLAFESDESGEDEIFLTRFPSGQGKWQVSIDGGRSPRWNPNGKELFFRHGYALWSVAVETRPSTSGGRLSVELGKPELLFSKQTEGIILWFGFDVADDGQRFVVVQADRQELQHRGVTVVENWFAEFKSKN